MSHLMLVMTLLLASLQTVKLEDSEEDIEDVRKGQEIMRKLKANNLSVHIELVFNKYAWGWDPWQIIHYTIFYFQAFKITDNNSECQLYQ